MTALEEQYFIFSREMRGGAARANILTCFSTPDSVDKLTGTAVRRGETGLESGTLQIENGRPGFVSRNKAHYYCKRISDQ